MHFRELEHWNTEISIKVKRVNYRGQIDNSPLVVLYKRAFREDGGCSVPVVKRQKIIEMADQNLYKDTVTKYIGRNRIRYEVQVSYERDWHDPPLKFLNLRDMAAFLRSEAIKLEREAHMNDQILNWLNDNPQLEQMPEEIFSKLLRVEALRIKEAIAKVIK